jgi:pimeloyl-ACP methyl ester carboxylesterase
MRIQHGRIGLELHQLADGRGPALLAFHELYGSSRDWQAPAMRWPGPIYALDFSGHGASDHLRGGAYMPEMLLADADAALARIGNAAVVGRGLGAWVALLLGGARRDAIPAVLLLTGRGIAGGAPVPTFAPDVFARYLAPGEGLPARVDKCVHVLEGDVRPADYAERFAAEARRLILCEDGNERPPWWEAVRGCPASIELRGSEEEAFERLLAEAKGSAG